MAAAETIAVPELEILPICPANPSHGAMFARSKDGQTREQLWCGTWYDCHRCYSSVLHPSPELIESRAQPEPRDANADTLSARNAESPSATTHTEGHLAGQPEPRGVETDG